MQNLAKTIVNRNNLSNKTKSFQNKPSQKYYIKQQYALTETYKPSKLNNRHDYLSILLVSKGTLTKRLELFHHSSFSSIQKELCLYKNHSQHWQLSEGRKQKGRKCSQKKNTSINLYFVCPVNKYFTLPTIWCLVKMR